MSKLLLTLAALFVATMMPSAAWALIGEIDAAFVRSEILCNDPTDSILDSLRLSDSGGTFGICATRKSAPGRSDGMSVEFRVFKFDAQGRPDIGWGENGVAKHTIDQLIFVSRAKTLRDGGIALFLENGIAFRFSKNGTLVPEFGSKGDILLVPRDAPKDNFGWIFRGLQEGPTGDFAALASSFTPSRQNLEQSSQLLAVRRFAADGEFVEELRYRIDLTAFTSASGVQRDPVDAGLLYWGLDGNTLSIAGATGGYDRLVGLTLSADGGQAVRKSPLFPNASGPQFRARSLYVLPDGKLVALTGVPVTEQTRSNEGRSAYGVGRIYRWNADGSPDLSFGAGGSKDHGLGTVCNTTSLSLHANGEYSIKGSFVVSRGFAIFCDGGFLSVATYNGSAVIDRSVVSPSGSSNYVIDRRGGVVHLEASTIDANGISVPRDRPLLTRILGYGGRADVKVVEYYNPDLDHYFITAHEHEIDFVDKGKAGATWRRTGNSFGAWNIDTPMPGTETVCRFYGDQVAGPNSHFLSAEAIECDLLRSMELATPLGKAAWRFERDAFRITVPTNGACPANLTPVTRFYNGMFAAGGEPNHRYVTRQVDIDAMTKRGWFNEGVRMCAVLE